MTRARVLIAEDNRIIAEGIALSLARFDYQVTGIVASGEDAVEKARKLRPDAVLMDIVLEGKMHGIEAAREIIEMNIPVIFLTGIADEATVEEAEKVGPSGFIKKPFAVKKICEVIERVVGGCEG